MKTWRLLSTKRRIAAVALAGAVLGGGAGVASAVFPAGKGSATGYGKVATVTKIPVKFVTETGGPMSPGMTTTDVTLTFTAHNSTTTKPLGIHKITATVVTKTGNIVTFTTGNTVTGCKSSWFTASITPSPPFTIAAGATATEHVTMYLETVPTTQGACAGKNPQLTLTVLA